jgi:hypothetical protein
MFGLARGAADAVSGAALGRGLAARRLVDEVNLPKDEAKRDSSGVRAQTDRITRNKQLALTENGPRNQCCDVGHVPAARPNGGRIAFLRG